MPTPKISLPLRACGVAAALGAALLLGGSRPASADLATVSQFTGLGGANPNTLILGRDGNFYGTTESGGSKGCGTVFVMTPAGARTKLVNFNDTNGNTPLSLIQAKDGSFYGTTDTGGGSGRFGTVFRLVTDGTAAGTTMTILYRFPDDGSAGQRPNALTQAADGSFYGTTVYGGTNVNYGVVFHLTTDGTAAGTTETTLLRFPANGSLGGIPSALIQAKDGSFYGTTEISRPNAEDETGPGSVFRLTSDGTAAGTTLTTLYDFPGDFLQGAYPEAALTQAADGSFYGTTVEGGDTATNNDGYGTIFRLTTDGTASGTALTSLYAFGGPDGSDLETPLLQAPDGSFYGIAEGGGTGSSSYGAGTVFHLTTDGTAAGSDLTTLVNFAGPDGFSPTALLQADDGSFYGTTFTNGPVTLPFNGDGQVFHLTSAQTPADSVVTVTIPASVPSGGAAVGEVTLREIATVPVMVALTSSEPSDLSVPDSVTVTPGHRHAYFTAQAGTVSSAKPVTLAAASLAALGVGRSQKAHTTVTP